MHSLIFTAPYEVTVQSGPQPVPEAGQVLVRTLCSAISPGTELLVYRGEFPQEMAVDASINALSGEFRYPLRYGYSSVGQVLDAGAGVDPAWVGRRVFGFYPHASHFTAAPEALQTLPDEVSVEGAAFLPNLETAVNLVMDGAPVIGERVVVFGQGVVGLLTTAALARFPLDRLVTLDRYPLRQEASVQMGASVCLDPAAPDTPTRLRSLFPDGADLVFELSGAPSALDAAIDIAAFSGRVVVGSWYGRKRAALDLGGKFHRSRLRLISSQVSTLSPELTGRWTKARRFAVAWELLRQVQPEWLITHRFPLAQAAEAFRILDQEPGGAIQILLTYGG